MATKKKKTVKKAAPKLVKVSIPKGKSLPPKHPLKFITAEEVALVFRKPSERRAIQAVLRWLGLNSVCAWKIGKGHFTPDMALGEGSRRVFRELEDVAAVILDWDKLEEIEKLFGVR